MVYSVRMVQITSRKMEITIRRKRREVKKRAQLE